MAEQRHESGSGERRRARALIQEFNPQRPIILIESTGPREIAADKLSAVEVGCKALGVSVLPPPWTLPFFVVSAECFEKHIPRHKLDEWIVNCIAHAGLAASGPLMIRSSGTVETMRDRGSLVSERCAASEIISTIEELRAKIPEPGCSHVHWIIQEAIDPQCTGHLSNERRVSREPRDWLVEFEASKDRRGYAVPIGIRTWREGGDISSMDLSCSSETEITLRLRQVAKWGFQFAPRVHFEWVWDGHKLWIVQADPEESASGTDPNSTLPTAIPKVEIGELRAFRLAKPDDYESYGKLRNVDLYRRLGYEMPPFFVADGPAVISRILRGDVSDDLERDLFALIKRPLIIRTDGASIPSEKREMLPRSDPLASAVEAKDWLLNYFRNEIQKADLAEGKLCLIAHHFIPSVASAWARAEPGNRLVRIEALWGIPEGLYWYSHDTFEVDTQEVLLSETMDHARFRTSERLRYKGTFVAADEPGNGPVPRSRSI